MVHKNNKVQKRVFLNSKKKNTKYYKFYFLYNFYQQANTHLVHKIHHQNQVSGKDTQSQLQIVGKYHHSDNYLLHKLQREKTLYDQPQQILKTTNLEYYIWHIFVKHAIRISKIQSIDVVLLVRKRKKRNKRIRQMQEEKLSKNAEMKTILPHVFA